MDPKTSPVWLGFRRGGGRFCLDPSDLRAGVSVVGPGADSAAASLASACGESGLKTFVVDLDGGLARRLEGRFAVWGWGSFLYDSQRMEEKASLHAELAASAYTASLNLSFEQEGFLNSAIQYIAMEGGVASPSSLADRLSAEGEFRGRTADELRGKLVALRSLNITGDQGAVRRMLAGGSVADFSGAESRQAGEVAAMLLLAKVLAVAGSGGRIPEVLVVAGANRVFADMPRARHGDRLLSALLSAETSRVIASEATYALDRDILETSHVRILSGALHNGGWGDRPRREATRVTPLVLTPNMFVLQDLSRGYEEVFIPRDHVRLQPLGEEDPIPPARGGPTDDALVKRVLGTFAQYDHATRGSVVGFLAAEDPPSTVEGCIDRLHAEGCLVVVGKDLRRDSPLQTFRLTEKGYDLLRRVG